MPLSVLRTPTNKNIFMLIETTTNDVIDKGGMDEMYGLKHSIEETEQQKSNEKWMAGIFSDRLELIGKLMKSTDSAERILKINMPSYYTAWLKYKEIL